MCIYVYRLVHQEPVDCAKTIARNDLVLYVYVSNILNSVHLHKEDLEIYNSKLLVYGSFVRNHQ